MTATSMSYPINNVSITGSKPVGATCNTACIAITSTVVSLVAVSVLALTFYLTWGRGNLKARRTRREEKHIALTKLDGMDEFDAESVEGEKARVERLEEGAR